jgi:hypothetical protein
MKIRTNIKLAEMYEVECFDKHGNLKWTDIINNLVVDEGLDDSLDKYFKASAYTSAHYAGLTDGTPVVADIDTLASHAGWVEVTAYTGDRKAITWGTVSGESVDNSANKASFAINANGTVMGGAFVCTVASGTGGTLYGGGVLTAGDKELDDGDTLNVTITASASAT